MAVAARQNDFLFRLQKFREDQLQARQACSAPHQSPGITRGTYIANPPGAFAVPFPTHQKRPSRSLPPRHGSNKLDARMWRVLRHCADVGYDIVAEHPAVPTAAPGSQSVGTRTQPRQRGLPPCLVAEAGGPRRIGRRCRRARAAAWGILQPSQRHSQLRPHTSSKYVSIDIRTLRSLRP